MKKILNYTKSYIIWIVFFLVYLLFMSILGYTGPFKLSTISIINFCVMDIVMLILGIINGKKASKRGYLEGLKFGGIIVLILFILNLIFVRTFSLYLFLYYLLLIVSSIIGSMIGINLHH